MGGRFHSFRNLAAAIKALFDDSNASEATDVTSPENNSNMYLDHPQDWVMLTAKSEHLDEAHATCLTPS